jgi:hypothetical protein
MPLHIFLTPLLVLVLASAFAVVLVVLVAVVEREC